MAEHECTYIQKLRVSTRITLECILLMCCKTLNITSVSPEFDIGCHGDLNIENGVQQDYENSNSGVITHAHAVTHGGGIE